MTRSSSQSRQFREMLLGPMDPLLERPTSREAPCEQVLRHTLDHLEELYYLNPDKLWIYVGEAAKRSMWIFCRLVIQDRWMDPWWHGEDIMGFLQAHPGQDRIVVTPRGAGKTTVVTQRFPAWVLASNPLLICQINNASQQKAADFAGASASVIAENKRYRDCYPYLVPSRQKWGGKGYQIDLPTYYSYAENEMNVAKALEGSMFDESTLSMGIKRHDFTYGFYGVDGNITGSHPTLQIHDDLLNHITAKSPNEIAKAERFFRESIKCVDSTGVVVVATTIWTESDYASKIVRGEIVRNEPFKVLCQGVYRENGECIFPARVFFTATGVKGESGYTPKFLENIKSDPDYEPLYLCRAKSPGKDIFDFDSIQFFDAPELAVNLGPTQCIAIESDGQQSSFIEGFKKYLKDENRRIEVVELSSGRVDKNLRIRNVLSPELSSGRFHVERRVWDGRMSFGAELRAFPTWEERDILDAVQYLCSIAKNPPPGAHARVIVTVDPAFSDGKDSSYVGIAAGFRYDDCLYLLDVDKFKTSSSSLLFRAMVRMHDKWSFGAQLRKEVHKPMYNRVRPIGSMARGPSMGRRMLGPAPSMKLDSPFKGRKTNGY